MEATKQIIDTRNPLALWRERMGYDVNAAAEALGCSPSTLNDWEAANRLPRYIELAMAALACGIGPYGAKVGQG